MEPPPLPTAPDTGSVQRCLESFSADLSTRYRDDQIVPSASVGTRRFSGLQNANGQPAFICLRHYEVPLTPVQMDAQRAILSRISRMETPMLCGLIESRVEPHGHFIVSTLAGSISLHQLLRQQRRLDFATVCELLTNIAEALETATTARWPRCMVDLHALFINQANTDALRQPVKLIVPPLPGPEIVPGMVSIPTSSQEYVMDLALMTCELLGMPVRGQRFRPLPQLSAETNQILRSVIEGGAAPLFESARKFTGFLRGGVRGEPASYILPNNTPVSTPTAQETRPPTLPVTDEKHEPALPASTLTDAPTVAVPAPERQPDRLLECLPQPAAPGSTLPPMLRLQPVGLGPVIGLCVGDEIKVGRGVKAHHIAQFFPRNPRNDDRTRLLSREHLALSRQGTQLWIRDLPGANHSFASGKPIGSKLGISRFSRVTIAGEYDLEVRKLDTWWPDGEPWKDLPDALPSVTGAALLSPASTTPALEMRTLWLFTDAAFGISTRGELNLQPVSSRDVLGWFLVAHKSAWILASEDDGSIALDGQPLRAKQPMPLGNATRLRVGSLEWNLSPLTPE